MPMPDEIVGLLRRGGYRTLTTAADGASERMRDIIQRKTKERHLLRAAKLARAHGMSQFKLYMMIGVPGETDADIDELGRFSLELAQAAGRMALGIAPFVAFRPYEQIRTDVCLHKLPVKLVGNGGGYGYGIMGATHHALEDIGALRVLPNMRLYLPLTASDVPEVVNMMARDPLPNYLRLNAAAEIPGEALPFAPWRKIKAGRKCVVIGIGPVLGNLYELGDQALFEDLEIWNVGLLPLEEIPTDLLASIEEKQRVVAIEEHYRSCGLAEALSYHLLKQGVCPRSFTSLHAEGYPSGRYGSQRWHQEESGLAGRGLRSHLERVVLG